MSSILNICSQFSVRSCCPLKSYGLPDVTRLVASLSLTDELCSNYHSDSLRSDRFYHFSPSHFWNVLLDITFVINCNKINKSCLPVSLIFSPHNNFNCDYKAVLAMHIFKIKWLNNWTHLTVNLFFHKYFEHEISFLLDSCKKIYCSVIWGTFVFLHEQKMLRAKNLVYTDALVFPLGLTTCRLFVDFQWQSEKPF